jgi:hypothetical protein
MKIETEINSIKNNKLRQRLRTFSKEESINDKNKNEHKAICFTKINDKYFDLNPIDELYGYFFIYLKIYLLK